VNIVATNSLIRESSHRHGSLRVAVREVFFAGAYYSGLSHIHSVIAGPRTLILCYHNVLPREMLGTDDAYKVDIAADVFERQLQMLIRHWHVLPARLLESESSGMHPPDHRGGGVFLSFDDGMLNNFSIVEPLLRKYEVTAMFAVVPGLIDGAIPHLWRDHLYLLLRHACGGALRLPMDDYAKPVAVLPGQMDHIAAQFRQWVISRRVSDVYGVLRDICNRNGLSFSRYDHQPERFHPMSWEMVHKLQERGHVIGSHTLTHRILRLLPSTQRLAELRQSKAVLEERIGRPVNHLVYPYGSSAEVDAYSMRLARQCGYQFGFMNVPWRVRGPALMSIPRFSLPPNASAAMSHVTMSGLRHKIQWLGGRSRQPRVRVPFPGREPAWDSSRIEKLDMASVAPAAPPAARDADRVCEARRVSGVVGCRVGIFPFGSTANPYQELVARSLESQGLHVERIRGGSRFFPITRALAAPIDLLHMDWPHSFYTGRNTAAQWSKRAMYAMGLWQLKSRPLVWTAHNIVSHDSPDPAYDAVMIQKLIECCDAIQVMSVAAAKLMAQTYRIPSSTIVKVIPHGHYADVYANNIDRATARQKLGITPNQRVVLYSGRIRRYKGLDTLLEEFAVFCSPGDMLIVAGRNEAPAVVEQLSPLIQQVEKQGAQVRLITTAVPDDQLQIYFQACDVVALPFRNVLNSGSLLLAMSFGRCVVVPRMGSMPEIACPQASFFYDADEPHGLARALGEAFDTPDLLARGAAAREFALERYDWRRIGLSLATLYEQVLSRY
jgi:glycosyltransferase involved in cell wall biosynthesis/peptidoglycan/xylan/chitin deacetylase (PgdA/CDA1 family)